MLGNTEMQAPTPKNIEKQRGRLMRFEEPPVILACASAVGHEEHRGRFGGEYDYHDDSDRFGAKTWELSENALAGITLNLALNKAKLGTEDIDLLVAGDLQNQCVATSGGLGGFGIPYIGIYGACSTFCEGLLVASLALRNGGTERVAVVTTSHNCAAERQFRLPLEYGGQRTPTAQWTATAGGAVILQRGSREEQGGVRVLQGMAGKIVDGGIKDAANMGAAMAPAAADTLQTYLALTHTHPDDYDVIVTGDLGIEGSAIFCHLLAEQGILLGGKHQDCGALIYDRARQDAHSGGSGCGCAAAVMSAHFLPRLARGELSEVLFMATGALMSPSSLQQGGTIGGIAPLIRLRGAGTARAGG